MLELDAPSGPGDVGLTLTWGQERTSPTWLGAVSLLARPLSHGSVYVIDTGFHEGVAGGAIAAVEDTNPGLPLVIAGGVIATVRTSMTVPTVVSWVVVG